MIVLRKEKPDLIISSGAAVAVPFFWLGKLFGAKTMYIEVFDRIDKSTLSGKLVYPVADNEDAWMVKFIFEEFLKGKSLQKISDELAAKGGVGIHSGKPLTKSAVKAVLQSEVYVGDRIIQKQAPRNYLTHKPDPTIPAQQFLVTDGHTPIIDRDTWNKVQEKLKEQKKIREDTGCVIGADSHPLYGRVICGSCGSPFKRVKRRRGGEVYYEWTCKNRKLKEKDDPERCHSRIIREEDLLAGIKKLLPVRRYRKDQYHPEIWERVPEDQKVYVYEDHLEIK
jgi:hypothetical protein